MKLFFRNIGALIIGIVIGSIINIGFIILGGNIFPLPESFDSMNALNWDIKYFLFPFSAHAIGTFSGSFMGSKICKNYSKLIGLQNEKLNCALEGKDLSYAKERVQGRSNDQSERVTIIHHPDVRRMLLKMRSQIEVMRILVYLNTLELDLAANNQQHSLRADLLTPITKGWCSELCQEITSIGLQIHGGMGYVEETGAAQHFRDSRITTIYEGTTGIQANDLIGRKVIKDNGSELNRFISEISSEIDAMDSVEENLLVIKKRMQEAIEVVKNSVNYIFPHIVFSYL